MKALFGLSLAIAGLTGVVIALRMIDDQINEDDDDDEKEPEGQRKVEDSEIKAPCEGGPCLKASALEEEISANDSSPTSLLESEASAVPLDSAPLGVVSSMRPSALLAADVDLEPYILGDVNTNVDCPEGYGEIDDEQTCLTAATSLKLPFRGSGSWGNNARGCIKANGNQAYMNNHDTGTAVRTTSPICKEAAPAPTPAPRVKGQKAAADAKAKDASAVRLQAAMRGRMARNEADAERKRKQAEIEASDPAPPTPQVKGQQQEPYVLGDANTNVDCPAGYGEIDDEQTCSAAATSLKLPFRGSGNWDNNARGCIKANGNQVYMNNHATGIAVPTTSPVCKEATATAAAPTPAPEVQAEYAGEFAKMPRGVDCEVSQQLTTAAECEEAAQAFKDSFNTCCRDVLVERYGCTLRSDGDVIFNGNAESPVLISKRNEDRVAICKKRGICVQGTTCHAGDCCALGTSCDTCPHGHESSIPQECASEGLSACKQAPIAPTPAGPPAANSVSVDMTVSGVTYDLLIANLKLKKQFKKAIRSSIGKEADLSDMSDITLYLKAYVKAAGAANCPSGLMVATARECETAGAAVGHPFAKEVSNKHERPAGCFWDQNGGSYFNTELEASVENGWAGAGAICLAEASEKKSSLLEKGNTFVASTPTATVASVTITPPFGSFNAVVGSLKASSTLAATVVAQVSAIPGIQSVAPGTITVTYTIVANDEGWTKIVLRASDKCVDEDNHGDLYVRDCKDTNGQKWRNSAGAIQTKKRSQCLDNDNGWPKTVPCTGSAEQKWTVTRTGQLMNADTCLQPMQSGADRLKMLACPSSPTWQSDLPVACVGFDCPIKFLLNSAAASIVGNDQDICCEHACNGFTCPADYLDKSDAAKIVGNDKHTCCDNACSGFNCPADYTAKTPANSLVGNDKGACCEKVCSGFQCPAKYIKKAGAATIVGNSRDTCCDHACDGFNCPTNFIAKLGGDSIMGNDRDTCCDNACSGFTCLTNFLLKSGADNIVGNDEGTCCNKACSGFQCPVNYLMKSGAQSIVGNSQGTCCDNACSGFHCPTNFISKSAAESISGNNQGTCCDNACSGFTCSVNYLMKSGAESIVGNNQGTCCEPACSGFTCQGHFISKPDASNIVGDNQDICCDAACSGFQCATNYILKSGADSIAGNAQGTCCIKACSGFSCPTNFILKSGAPKAGNDKNTCCDAACSGFQCPADFISKSGAVGIAGDDLGTCCDNACSGFQCPNKFILKSGADAIVGNRRNICCDEACSGFDCPTNYIPKPNGETITGNRRGKCCNHACSGFNCPVNYLGKSDGTSIVGNERDTCCDEACSGFSCPVNFLPKDDVESIVGDDKGTCCDAACSGFKCPALYLPKPQGASIVGDDRGTCCDKACSGFNCQGHSMSKPGPSSIVGNDQATCCDDTCSGFQCPTNYIRIAGATSVAGTDRGTCCEQGCSGFTCPANYLSKAGAAAIKGNDRDTCCDQACSLFQCPAKYIRKPSASGIVGNDRGTCCDKACNGFTCGAHFIRKPKADLIAGNDRGTCCDRVCSGFSCPADYIDKPGGPNIRGNSRGTCCDSACSGFSCPGKYLIKPGADALVGDELGECCDRACSGFDCPSDYLPKPDVSNIVGNDRDTCCDQACSSFQCPANFVLKPDPGNTVGDERGECCDRACSGFKCPGKYLPKPGGDKIAGSDRSTCCNNGCGGFSCPANYVPKSGASTITGNDRGTCCDKACSGFNCPTNYLPKPNGANTRGDDRGTCCNRACSGFNCPANYLAKPNGAGIVGTSRDTCCNQACSGFKCPTNYLAKLGGASTVGSDRGTCCDPACSGFSCPTHFLAKPNSVSIKGNSQGTCCDQACSGFQCPAKFLAKSNGANIVGNNQPTCCDPACSGFSCPTNFLPKSNSATIRATIGNTQGTCCDQACSGFTCPTNYLHKPNAASFIGNNRDTCCDEAPQATGFVGTSIVAWKVSRTTAKQAGGCRLHWDGSRDPLYSKGGGDWVSYFKSGFLNAGCGDACNNDNGVNLECHYRGKSRDRSSEGININAFAKTYLTVQAQKTVTLKLGSDDGIAVWLNGQLVHEHLGACRCYGDAQETKQITLKAGANLLVIKVGENDGHFGFTAALSDISGIAASEEGPGFDGNNIVTWKVSKTTAKQAEGCALHWDPYRDALYSKGAGDWVSYSKSGFLNAGCGNACNNDNGVNLECHYRGVSKDTSSEGININAYAKTYLIADTQKTLTLRLGSDDGIAVWLNGELVHQHLGACRCYGDAQDTTQITLKAGANLLVIKVGENDGHFGFTAALSDTAGIAAAEEVETYSVYYDLPQQSPRNVATYKCGGHSTGSDESNFFNKVRLEFKNGHAFIDAADTTFATTSGSCTFRGTDVCQHDKWKFGGGGSNSCWYGRARSCHGTQDGQANLDLTGTPFVFPADIESKFELSAWYGRKSTTLSANRQVLDVRGGGQCGDVGLRMIPLEVQALKFCVVNDHGVQAVYDDVESARVKLSSIGSGNRMVCEMTNGQAGDPHATKSASGVSQHYAQNTNNHWNAYWCSWHCINPMRDKCNAHSECSATR